MGTSRDPVLSRAWGAVQALSRGNTRAHYSRTRLSQAELARLVGIVAWKGRAEYTRPARRCIEWNDGFAQRPQPPMAYRRQCTGKFNTGSRTRDGGRFPPRGDCASSAQTASRAKAAHLLEQEESPSDRRGPCGGNIPPRLLDGIRTTPAESGSFWGILDFRLAAGIVACGVLPIPH